MCVFYYVFNFLSSREHILCICYGVIHGFDMWNAIGVKLFEVFFSFSFSSNSCNSNGIKVAGHWEQHRGVVSSTFLFYYLITDFLLSECVKWFLRAHIARLHFLIYSVAINIPTICVHILCNVLPIKRNNEFSSTFFFVSAAVYNKVAIGHQPLVYSLPQCSRCFVDAI